MILENIFIFLFLILFPFGQIIRLSFDFLGASIPVQPIDIIVGLGALYAVFKNYRKPEIFRFIISFLNVAIFSYMISVFIFNTQNVIYGLFYLVRLASYFCFLIYVWNFVKENAKNKKLLIDSLLVVSVTSAVFGWVQFFTVPDLKALTIYGWDMHLFRLVGTFLDPAFLGLILVFGLIISIYKFLENKKWKWIVLIIFLLLSLAFTYSRASYLAFAAGILTVIYFMPKFKKLFFLVIGLAVIALILPTAKNHSIGLFRTFSAVDRIENYKSTLNIFSKSPLFGVGYDNMCIAYQKYIGPQDFSSHACSGSDSSLLFILATTGIVGFIVFVRLIVNLARLVNPKFIAAPALAMLVHSLFSNSLFYPWIMGYMVILLSISLKE